MNRSWIIQSVIAVISNSEKFKGPILLTFQPFVNLFFIAPCPEILQVCHIIYLFSKLLEILLCTGFTESAVKVRKPMIWTYFNQQLDLHFRAWQLLNPNIFWFLHDYLPIIHVSLYKCIELISMIFQKWTKIQNNSLSEILSDRD